MVIGYGRKWCVRFQGPAKAGPAGFASGNSNVWNVNTTGNINNNNVTDTYCLRAVLIMNADTQITDGDGTKENPFVVE